ncbi:hypothetical protein P154DRAFT_259455 [Amniculicola lignicola CBS 123094]|uniref:Uncharacterized protein n=1 Tax=Amniculicola lignicola CBS 123094 TaxID=1392246 RepID=A0A6A5WXB0_9PLEO|nr:hypothetical protein P154DRAFT_259455 [Amniculicola lignicola CBS 123094]
MTRNRSSAASGSWGCTHDRRLPSHPLAARKLFRHIALSSDISSSSERPGVSLTKTSLLGSFGYLSHQFPIACCCLLRLVPVLLGTVNRATRGSCSTNMTMRRIHGQGHLVGNRGFRYMPYHVVVGHSYCMMLEDAVFERMHHIKTRRMQATTLFHSPLDLS